MSGPSEQQVKRHLEVFLSAVVVGYDTMPEADREVFRDWWRDKSRAALEAAGVGDEAEAAERAAKALATKALHDACAENVALRSQVAFWKDRYETQHRTLHSCEDALAESCSQVRELVEALRELAGEYGCGRLEPLDPSMRVESESCRSRRPDDSGEWCYACVASAALASVRERGLG